MLRRALCSGSCASLCSTLAISWLSHRRTRATAAATNATSQWLWGGEAHRQDRVSVRHTLAGYLIHHASSLFWAIAFERLRRGRRDRPRMAALATATSAVAYAVDYHVVPRRLSPGFDRRLHGRDLAVIYASFALGLAVPWLLARGRGTTRMRGGR